MFRFNKISIFIIMVAGMLPAKGQQVTTAKGNAQVMVGDNLSLDEAKQKAEQLAIINAIENEFGTYVEQDASTYVKNGDPEFRIIGNTRVRGEWLKTVSESFDVATNRVKGQGRSGRQTWVSCNIKGEVREATKPAIAVKFLPLNCPEMTCRTYDFNNGEPFYLFFSSPVNGNLMVFMGAEDGKVYRLLPYKSMKGPYSNEVPVKADKDYIFFAAGDQYDYFGNDSYQSVDEMVMETEKNQEVMNLYVIFSPENIGKPKLFRENNDNGTLPFYLGEKDFEDWLAENRIYDPDFTYKQVSLTISK